ncbi:MAG: metallophosphoesterase [Chitinophagales bacterium]|nr:metallophosphoesterase [Chitinophagales bacterium]MDW8419317.1 metallophosphoesterase [Chitinophagales bacterium]
MKKTAFLFFLMCVNSAFSQVQVTVGPYLQSPTPGGIKILWRTDTPSVSKVMVGTSPTQLTQVFTDTAMVKHHVVTVTGLQPYTKYYYGIYDGSNLIAGGDAEHWFRTFPQPGSQTPLRVWAIGDFGKGNTYQQRVRDAFVQYDTVGTDFFIMLGDNAYNDGTEAEYLTKVFDSVNGYAKLMRHLPFLPTPGNHDYNVISPVTAPKPPLQHSGPYYDFVEVYRQGEAGGVPSGNELYYSFDFGNVHFISLNSELGSLFNAADDWTGVSPYFTFTTSPMRDWLIQDLQANTKPWVIVFFHQPPYTDGSHDAGNWWEVFMKAMRKNFAPIWEQYGVDLVMSGHSHVYERSYLVKGAYGDVADITLFNIVQNTSGREADGGAYIKYLQGAQPNKGTVYVVCGNSGSKDDDPPFNHPYMYSEYGCDTCCGSFILDIAGNKLTGRFLDMAGTIRDEFVIYKVNWALGNDEPRSNSVFTNPRVIPNPFGDYIETSLTLHKSCEVILELTDVNGKAYLLKKVNLAAGSQQLKFDVSDSRLAQGAYLFTMRAGDEKWSTVVVKTR